MNNIFDLLSNSKLLKEQLLEAKAVRAWNEQIGGYFLKHTQKAYVQERVLHLQISSAAARQELSLSKNKIKTLINEILEENFIESVSIWG
jgi:hypothetical protein